MGSAQLLKHFPLLLQSRLHMNKVMKKAPCGLQFSEEVMNVIGRLEKRGVSLCPALASEGRHRTCFPQTHPLSLPTSMLASQPSPLKLSATAHVRSGRIYMQFSL